MHLPEEINLEKKTSGLNKKYNLGIQTTAHSNCSILQLSRDGLKKIKEEGEIFFNYNTIQKIWFNVYLKPS